jgi:hypothetical protein
MSKRAEQLKWFDIDMNMYDADTELCIDKYVHCWFYLLSSENHVTDCAIA